MFAWKFNIDTPGAKRRLLDFAASKHASIISDSLNQELNYMYSMTAVASIQCLTHAVIKTHRVALPL